MPTSRARLFAAAAALGFAAAAWAQQRPESILPPGFGEPAQPAPAASRTPAAGSAPAPAPAPGTATVQPLPSDAGSPDAEPSPTDTPTPDAALLAEYALPSYARRPLSVVGAAGPVQGGVPADGFGDADGRWLEAMMRGWRGPVASRWLHIALRRALVSPLDTPARVNGADFAAERAWLLLRMGEATAARSVVQGVDDGNYTPKLYQVAVQVALATADPAALCPLVDAAAADPERAWIMARPICAALTGAPGAAAPLMAAARRQRVATGIDYQLAQKLVAAGAQGRQAVTIEWDAVGQLTAWRFGLAVAAGVAIPDQLYATVGPQVTGWRALAPAIPLAERAAPADRAAATGTLSSAALVDLYSALDEADDRPAELAATANDLRAAYGEGGADARRAALDRLWGAADARADYARLVLTARAAALVRPDRRDAGADRLVAAMLSAGLDRTAERWRGLVPEGGDAWAMLLLADPDATDALPYATLGRYAGRGDAALKQRLFFAGLAGLGRLAPDDAERGARALDVRIGAINGWTRALDRAARAGQPGTVLLLAAIGVQTGGWRGVSPEALYRIVGALRATGQDGTARMVAAEAIART